MAMSLEDYIDKLKSAGGGIAAVIVAKDGTFVRTVYQEANIQTKKELDEFLHNIPTGLLPFFDDELKKIK